MPPEKYQQFVAGFRMELDAVLARVPSSPENKGLHAQILARLGAQERGQALASLEQALADDSENPALLVAKGSIPHEQKDFPAAAELARQAWEASGRKDQRAWVHPASDRRAPPVRHGRDLALRAGGDERRPDLAFGAEDLREVQVRSIEAADTLSYVEQAATAIEAGRGKEGVAWAQKAYDRNPSEDTYGILQDVRRRSAELDVKRAAEPPAKAPAPKRSSPLLPILLITGAGLIVSGGYKIAKPKDTRTSDDGINPAPYVSPEQARRNYVNSAVLIGVPIVVAGLVYGGPII